ncbi:transcriptional regulator of marR family [Novosphingobium sp. MD-1]|nr:transcriptional regulator of marR family [Novosphingobium sp. MD-1]
MDYALRPFGLSESLGAPLIYLGRSGGGLSQNELAERSGIGGPALVRVVDRLVAMNLMTRHIDEEDKRLRRLHLTAKGEALVFQLEEALDRLRDVIMAEVTDEDVTVFLSVVDKVGAALDRLDLASAFLSNDEGAGA